MAIEMATKQKTGMSVRWIWIAAIIIALVVGTVGGYFYGNYVGSQSLAKSPTQVRMGITPYSMYSAMIQNFQEVRDKWTAAETKYNVKFTWAWPEEDVTTFFYGGVDVIAVGALEAAEMKYNRDYETYVFGILNWNEDVFIVRGNSTYQSLNDLKGKKLAHFGWDSGAVKFAELLVKKDFNLNLTTDFEWVVAPPDVCVELLNNGDVEAALVYSTPWTYGVAHYGMRILYGPFTETWKALTGDRGLANEGLVTTKQMLDNHPEVAKAIIEGCSATRDFFIANTTRGYQYYHGSYSPEQKAAFNAIYPPDVYFPIPGPLTQGIIDSEFQSLTMAYELGLLDKQPTKDIFFTY